MLGIKTVDMTWLVPPWRGLKPGQIWMTWPQDGDPFLAAVLVTNSRAPATPFWEYSVICWDQGTLMDLATGDIWDRWDAPSIDWIAEIKPPETAEQAKRRFAGLPVGQVGGH